MPAKRMDGPRSDSTPSSTESSSPSGSGKSADEVRSAVKGGSSSSADEGIGFAESYREESSLRGGSSMGSSLFDSDSSAVSEPHALTSQEEE
ncbi:MAG TPA: hypothetical protein VJ874_06455 [Candidatus Thermoplasmatota archaeon]|nr:hypothetical protein [Candidatus Thermoplasmatota archaeon]